MSLLVQDPSAFGKPAELKADGKEVLKRHVSFKNHPNESINLEDSRQAGKGRSKSVPLHSNGEQATKGSILEKSNSKPI